MFRYLALLPSLFILFSPAWADTADCGGGGRCVVENGYYLAELPKDWDGTRKLPLAVFFHGYNSSPESMMRNRAMADAITGRGGIFVLPWAERGAWRQAGKGRAQRGRDELAFIRAVLADVKKRWPVDEKRMLASGFSLGGSMVWNIACYAGDLFTAYLPIAGGFWQSTPETCPSPPRHLRHIHGLKDEVVPYDKVGPYTSMPLGDTITLARNANSCKAGDGEAFRVSAKLRCTRQADCASGGSVTLCLHPGGHSVRAEWLGDGFDWMMALE